jgi:hypothetical protein
MRITFWPRTGMVGLLLALSLGTASAQVFSGTSTTQAVKPSYAEWAQPLMPEDDLGFLTVCFDQASPPDADFIADMMEALLLAGRLVPSEELDYFVGNRWSGPMGSPRALTWSFVPDGLSISSGVGEGAAPSSLFDTLDSKFATQGGRTTWVARIQSCFDRWAALSGTSYTRIKHLGQDWDDGASWGSSGSSTRGDIRISMKNIDGGGGVLAYCYFPSNGDMVLDKSENWGSSSNQNRFMRNVVAHELGHALGIRHVCSNNAAFLMEPFLSTSFDGPRHDDIRAVQRLYGDPREIDDTPAQAKDLGTLGVGTHSNACAIPAPLTGTNPANSANCSLDADGENDYFKFTVTSAATVTVTITPEGFTYDNNAQSTSGSCPSGSSVNSKAIANLNVSILDTDGISVLNAGASAPAGSPESASADLDSPGAYYIRVLESGTFSQSQLFSMVIAIEPGATGAQCPADVNGDGVVDQADLGLLLAAYGCSADCDVDLDGDGVTDQADLGLMLSAYGTTCQ